MIVHLHLQPLVAKGVRGLGKHLPVISSFGRFTEKLETYRKAIMTVLPCIKTGTLVISPRTENDLLVEKDHGRAVFADPSRVRS